VRAQVGAEMSPAERKKRASMLSSIEFEYNVFPSGAPKRAFHPAGETPSKRGKSGRRRLRKVSTWVGVGLFG